MAATLVPKTMQIQLGRLFGASSREARKPNRTAVEWKKTLRHVLHELDRYVSENVDTDELHRLMIASGLYAADESLKERDFWPGYAEGLTRALLVLLGDYPDHRRRKGGAKGSNYYRLQLCRSLQYIQSPDQRFRTLLLAGTNGIPGLSRPPREVLNDFHIRYGYMPSSLEFIRWYRKNLPKDYSAIFS